MRAEAPKNNNAKKYGKSPQQIIVEVKPHERQTDHKIAEAIGTNRTYVSHGGKKYGETYKAAIDATGMSYGTVTTFASVCKAFESSRRKEHLTFTHHMAVWSLEPEQQDELLDRAEAERLSLAIPH